MTAINLLQDGEKARDEHVAGLLALVLLQGKACPMSTDEIKLLQSGKDPSAKRETTGHSAEHAVELALILHRLMAWVLGQHAWLRVDQSSATPGTKSPTPLMISWDSQSLFGVRGWM
jgi:hypothetical protein